MQGTIPHVMKYIKFLTVLGLCSHRSPLSRVPNSVDLITYEINKIYGKPRSHLHIHFHNKGNLLHISYALVHKTYFRSQKYSLTYKWIKPEYYIIHQTGAVKIYR
jgi:hypothetical protein